MKYIERHFWFSLSYALDEILVFFSISALQIKRVWDIEAWLDGGRRKRRVREGAAAAAHCSEHTALSLILFSLTLSPFSSAFHQNWCQIVVTHASLEQSMRWILLTAKSSASKIAQNHSSLTRQPYRSTARLLSNPSTKFFAITETPTRNNKIWYCLSAEYSI